MEHEPAIVVTVALDADGSIALSLSATEHPVDELRKAAAVLERYAASIERENEPVLCETCGISPTGVRAAPNGPWQLLPCGHSERATTQVAVHTAVLSALTGDARNATTSRIQPAANAARRIAPLPTQPG